MRTLPLLAMLLLTACTTSAPSGPERPMDEGPAQQTLPDGTREYGFANGCTIVLEAAQAVVLSEGDVCAPYQRDIALLYASGD